MAFDFRHNVVHKAKLLIVRYLMSLQHYLVYIEVHYIPDYVMHLTKYLHLSDSALHSDTAAFY